MKFRSGSQSGSPVPSLEQSLQDLHTFLAQHQKQWAEQLARDPDSFGQLEEHIHKSFQQLADRCTASLLAHAAAQPACAQAAQKK